MPERGTLETITGHLVLAVQPLQTAVTDFDSFRQFLSRLAWDVRSLPPVYADIGTAVDQVIAAIADPEALDAAAIRRVLDSLRTLFEGLQRLSEAPAGVDAPVFLSELAQGVFDILLVDYIAAAFPPLYQVLSALRVIEHEFRAATADRPATLLTRINYAAIPEIVSD